MKIEKIKFTVDNQEIKDALSLAVKSAGIKSSLPIIANKNICFVLKENSLYIYSTNLEHGVKVDIACQNEINPNSPDVSFVVPYDNLSEILKDCPKEVTMVYDDGTNKLAFAGKLSKVNIKCWDAIEYPLLRDLDSRHKISIDPIEFANSISTVLVCSAQEQARPVLSTVNFSQKDSAMRVAGADGYRLGIAELPYKNGKFSINIPASSAKVMSEVMTACVEDVWINVDSEPIFLCGKNKYGKEVYFFASLIEGNYPDFNNIISKTHDTKVVIDITETLKVLSFAKTFLDSGMIKLVITEKTIIVSSSNEEGEYNGEISNLIFNGKDLEIYLNISYLAEIINAVKKYSTNRNIALTFTDKSRPVFICPEDDENLIFVIMPMSGK